MIGNVLFNTESVFEFIEINDESIEQGRNDLVR